MNKETWLVVANGSVARIFKVQRKESLIEIHTLVHPASRLHNRDLVSDKPGRAFDSRGAGRHAMEPTIVPQQQECAEFAAELASYLEKAVARGDFDKLYIAAGPAQLGLIRQHISPQTKKILIGEVDKDMTHMKTDEIINHLPFIL